MNEEKKKLKNYETNLRWNNRKKEMNPRYVVSREKKSGKKKEKKTEIS